MELIAAVRRDEQREVAGDRPVVAGPHGNEVETELGADPTHER
jgi:hypothetical protein